jgi:hypothetical protein
MKLTKSILKQLIKEELQAVLDEALFDDLLEEEPKPTVQSDDCRKYGMFDKNFDVKACYKKVQANANKAAAAARGSTGTMRKSDYDKLSRVEKADLRLAYLKKKESAKHAEDFEK